MAGEGKLKGIEALRKSQRLTQPADGSPLVMDPEAHEAQQAEEGPLPPVVPVPKTDAAKALAAPKRVLLLSVAPEYHIAKVARFERHKAYVQPDQLERIRQIPGCGLDFFVAADIRALPENQRAAKISGLARRFVLAGALSRETPPFTEGELMQALGYRFVAADEE